MQKRLANVKRFELNSLAYSSVFNIGDTVISTPISRALALQKEGALFYSKHDLQFSDYPIFQLEPNWIEDPITVQKHTKHHENSINVGDVKVIAASQSSIIQVGSIGKIYADARIKHFRWIREED